MGTAIGSALDSVDASTLFILPLAMIEEHGPSEVNWGVRPTHPTNSAMYSSQVAGNVMTNGRKEQEDERNRDRPRREVERQTAADRAEEPTYDARTLPRCPMATVTRASRQPAAGYGCSNSTTALAATNIDPAGSEPSASDCRGDKIVHGY
jgi:hypothetical protein